VKNGTSSSNGPSVVHCAFTQVSDPVSFTDTSEKEIRSGLPSAVPRWSVEIRRGPAFLYSVQVATLGFLGPPRR
jgi:hypothetical protein